jgi:hypothetical protein
VRLLRLRHAMTEGMWKIAMKEGLVEVRKDVRGDGRFAGTGKRAGCPAPAGRGPSFPMNQKRDFVLLRGTRNDGRVWLRSRTTCGSAGH